MSFSALATLLDGRRIAVLTGAGCSTESGIPDYRGEGTRRRARNPIQFRDFMSNPSARRRYWARAMIGWHKFAHKLPNDGHQALAILERRGWLTGLITQNVDRLHHLAGSANVVELHGSLHEVVCLGCGELSSRTQLQAKLEELNPHFEAPAAEMAPDGDAEVEFTTGFRVVDCDRCGGDLKPHVVFFGEGVPSERVKAAWTIVDDADVLLVVGSSLAVYSGYRFVRGASRSGKPIAIVNLGETRGDQHARVTVAAPAGDILRRLAEAMGSPENLPIGVPRRVESSG